MVDRSVLRVGLIACGVDKEVERPSHSQHQTNAETATEGVDQLESAVPLLLVNGRGGGGDLRNKHFVVLNVCCVGVVLAVTDLPREVGDEESGVEDEPHHVVDEGGVSEASMATLVAYDPHACHDTALTDPIGHP